MREETGVVFRRSVISLGGSDSITFPAQISEFIGIKKGDKVIVSAERGRHGKFIAVWKEEPASTEDNKV